jgi:hypothetical protein
MAFAVRREEGKWWLCLRKGRTIRYASLPDNRRVELEFSSQANAKACADALNERYWKEYEKHERKKQYPPFAQEMVDLIQEYTE